MLHREDSSNQYTSFYVATAPPSNASPWNQKSEECNAANWAKDSLATNTINEALAQTINTSHLSEASYISEPTPMEVDDELEAKDRQLCPRIYFDNADDKFGCPQTYEEELEVNSDKQVQGFPVRDEGENDLPNFRQGSSWSSSSSDSSFGSSDSLDQYD
ncbi:unnamed protein product [Rodentolepis nana]|uniref:Ovule protein n=1 Tax=Rodentolepis nana TaxID=102285 RepID=A0A0R3TB25_RODNA|nr:unnamed protein product [Rodentolepis nana]